MIYLFTYRLWYTIGPHVNLLIDCTSTSSAQLRVTYWISIDIAAISTARADEGGAVHCGGTLKRYCQNWNTRVECVMLTVAVMFQPPVPGLLDWMDGKTWLVHEGNENRSNLLSSHVRSVLIGVFCGGSKSREDKANQIISASKPIRP